MSKKKKTILVVDDSPVMQKLTEKKLANNNFMVYAAYDGKECLEVAKEKKPDIILMDLSLPGIDGWEATRQIKADPATQAIPIIALTAHAMAGDEDKARKAGCDDYDTKPINLNRLLDKIKNLLGSHAP